LRIQLKGGFSILLLAVLVVFGGSLWAQEQTGEITGIVVSADDGSAVPGVLVECTGENLVGKKDTVTDVTGAFRFLFLPPGSYDIIFSLDGFKTFKRKGVRVDTGRTYKLDIAMEKGPGGQETVVTGNSPVIDVKHSSSTETIPKELFSKLPKGRNFMSIVTQRAGLNFESEYQTTAERDSGEFGAGVSFDGSSPSENVFYVDGVDTTTLYEGKAGTEVNFDFIEEIQLKSSGNAAEYGGSTGGVISVITRGGGNEFHGQLGFYVDGSALGYDPRPELRKHPLNGDIAEYVTYPEDDWTRLEVGFGLGGYIIKDKLWFFGGFMPKFKNTRRDGDNWPVPDANTWAGISTIFAGQTHISGSNDFKRKDTAYAATLKLTGQVTDKLRLSLNGTLDWSKWEGELPAVEGTGNPARNYAAAGYKDPKYTIGGSIDYAPGKNLVLNGSVGYYYADHKQSLGPTEPRWYHPVSNANVPGAVEIVPGGWANYGYYDGYQTLKQVENKLTGTFDVTYFGNLGGEHVFKAGVQFVRIGVDKDDAYPYDYNRFYWGRNYEYSNGTTMHTTLGYVEVRSPFGVLAKVNSTRWALYLQDAWTIGKKLTLNLGVRFEQEDIPAFAEGYDPPVRFDFNDKFAPRVGFVYDVSGDSSLKVFGSFGVYYDAVKLEMAEGSYGGFKWLSHYYDIVNPDWRNAYPERDHPQTGGLAGGQYFETRNWREVSFESTQPDMKPYQKNEYTLGVRKTLGENWSVGARILYNYILNAIEDIGILLPNGSEHYFNGNPGSDWIQAMFDDAIAAGLTPPGVRASKAVREYTSVTLNLDRTLKDNWLGGASYTWSRLYGNYTGLASSDEHGRKSPSVERFLDAWFLTYNQYGNEERGVLPTDRPHQFKVYGAYTFDFGLTLGLNAFAMAGTPLQTEMYLNGIQGYYPLGRGSDGRNPFLWQLDLYAEYNLKLSNKYTLNVNVNVSNVTNNKIAQRTYMLYNDAVVYMDEFDIKHGFNYADVIASKGAHLDPRYKMEYRYLDSISARIGVKFLF